MPILSNLFGPLRPARVPPVDAFQKIGHLRGRYRDSRPFLAHRPDELPCLEALHIQRHTDAIMPQKFHDIAFTATEAEDFTAVWVTAKTLLYCQCQGVYAPTHVSNTAGNPNLRTCWECNHDGSNTCTRRANAVGSIEGGMRSLA